MRMRAWPLCFSLGLALLADAFVLPVYGDEAGGNQTVEPIEQHKQVDTSKVDRKEQSRMDQADEGNALQSGGPPKLNYTDKDPPPPCSPCDCSLVNGRWVCK